LAGDHNIVGLAVDELEDERLTVGCFKLEIAVTLAIERCSACCQAIEVSSDSLGCPRVDRRRLRSQREQAINRSDLLEQLVRRGFHATTNHR
jgi:hypothetical protein